MTVRDLESRVCGDTEFVEEQEQEAGETDTASFSVPKDLNETEG